MRAKDTVSDEALSLNTFMAHEKKQRFVAVPKLDDRDNPVQRTSSRPTVGMGY